MKKILVNGSIAYDLLLSHDGSFADAFIRTDLEALSAVFLAPRFRKHHGGTAANIAWNVRLLGGSPLTVSTVGSDGGPYLALLRERGIDCAYVQSIADQSTATAIIATDSHERQIGFFHPGADASGLWPDLNEEREHIFAAIVSPRDLNLMLSALQWCKAVSVPVYFDPGQQIHNFSHDDLVRSITGSAGVFVNDYEWSVLRDKLNMTTADLHRLTATLIVTHGEHGLSITTKHETIDLNACQAERVINPTGAGDALRAGFLTALVQGWSLEQAGQLGAALASKVVETEGTLLDTLDYAELQSRCALTYGQSLPQLL